MSGVKAANFELTIGYEAAAIHCLCTSSNCRLTGRSPRIDLNMYSGEVPMSPKNDAERDQQAGHRDAAFVDADFRGKRGRERGYNAKR